jgi:hypothetical protein
MIIDYFLGLLESAAIVLTSRARGLKRVLRRVLDLLSYYLLLYLI